MDWRKRTWLKLTSNWFLWVWETQMPFGCSTGRNPPNVMYAFRHCFGFPNITHCLGCLENIWRLPNCSLWSSRQALVGHRRLFNNRWPQWYSRRTLEEYGQAVGISSRFLTQELTWLQWFAEIYNRKSCSVSTTARLLRSNGGLSELSWKVCNNVRYIYVIHLLQRYGHICERNYCVLCIPPWCTRPLQYLFGP